jgi:hypothetical protein
MVSASKNIRSQALELFPPILFWLVLFIFYYSISFPYPDWLDSPELAAAAARAGIFHAPGSPLAVLLGYLVSFLPAVGKSYSMAAFSPIFAAWGVAAVYQMIRRRISGANKRTMMMEILAILAALPLALAMGVVSQAARCEVYTLAFFFSALAILEIVAIAEDPQLRSGSLPRATFYLGLGFSVHPLIALVVASGLLPYLLQPQFRADSFAALRRAVGFGLLGCSPILLLPLMSRDLMDVRWGALDSFQGWFDFVRGAAFVNTFAKTAAQTSEIRFGLACLLLFQATGLALCAAWAISVYVGVRSRCRFTIAMLLISGLSFLTVFSQKEIMLSNPDLIGYLLPAVLAASILTLKSWQRLASAAIDPRFTGLGILLLALLAIVQQTFLEPVKSSASCSSADRFSRTLLNSVPPQALVVLSDFNLLFYMEYLQIVQQMRPDIFIVYSKQIADPRFYQELSARHPELKNPGIPRLTDGKLDLEKLTDDMPVVFDASPFLGALPPGPLYNSGPFWGTAPFSDSGGKSLVELMDPVCENPEVRDERFIDVISWHGYWSARLAFKTGKQDFGHSMLRKAYCLKPTDELLGSLALESGGKPSCE